MGRAWRRDYRAPEDGWPVTRDWLEHYIHLLRVKRCTWEAYIAALPACEEKDKLLAWVKGLPDENGKYTRGMWALKGHWEEITELKAENAERETALRAHEKLAIDTKRKKR